MFMTRPQYQGPIGKVKKMRPTGSGVQGARRGADRVGTPIERGGGPRRRAGHHDLLHGAAGTGLRPPDGGLGADHARILSGLFQGNWLGRRRLRGLGDGNGCQRALRLG